jgi:hypothetical protein
MVSQLIIMYLPWLSYGKSIKMFGHSSPELRSVASQSHRTEQLWRVFLGGEMVLL